MCWARVDIKKACGCVDPSQLWVTGAIEFFTNYTKMPILPFLSLLHENQKKSSDEILLPVGIEPRPLIASDSKSNTILSTLT